MNAMDINVTVTTLRAACFVMLVISGILAGVHYTSGKLTQAVNLLMLLFLALGMIGIVQMSYLSITWPCAVQFNNEPQEPNAKKEREQWLK